MRLRAVPPPAERRAPSFKWHAPPKAEPNETEILFFGFLLVTGPKNAKDLHKWAAGVRSERREALELQSEWRPAASWGTANGESLLFEPLREAYKSQWPGDALEAIARAIEQWPGGGQLDGLDRRHLSNHSACLHGVWDSPARGALGSMSRVAWHAFSFSSIPVLKCTPAKPVPVRFS